MFAHLQDHLHDVHAFVRSKVLQIWLSIVNAKALPLPRQQTVAELVIGRLKDKSSSVRKYAIQVVTALLRHNPFAANVSKAFNVALVCNALHNICVFYAELLRLTLVFEVVLVLV